MSTQSRSTDHILNPSSPIAKRFNGRNTRITLKLPIVNPANPLNHPYHSSLATGHFHLNNVTPLQNFKQKSIPTSKIEIEDNIESNKENIKESFHGISKLRFVCHNNSQKKDENIIIEDILRPLSEPSSNNEMVCNFKVLDSSPSSPIKVSGNNMYNKDPSSPLSILTKKALKHTIIEPGIVNNGASIGKRELRASTLINSVESKYRKIDSNDLEKLSFQQDISVFKKDSKSKKILLFPF